MAPQAMQLVVESTTSKYLYDVVPILSNFKKGLLLYPPDGLNIGAWSICPVGGYVPTVG